MQLKANSESFQPITIVLTGDSTREGFPIGETYNISNESDMEIITASIKVLEALRLGLKQPILIHPFFKDFVTWIGTWYNISTNENTPPVLDPNKIGGTVREQRRLLTSTVESNKHNLSRPDRSVDSVQELLNSNTIIPQHKKNKITESVEQVTFDLGAMFPGEQN